MTTLAPPRPVAASAPSFRLRKRAYKAALTAHVLSSVGWFGIAVLVAFAGFAALATDSPAQAEGLYRAIDLTPWLSIPVGVLAAATGLLLSLGTSYGVVKHWWVVAKIAISVAVVVTDAVVVARFADDAVATGSAPNPLNHAIVAHVVVLVIATVLSVFKPRGRTPWRRAS